MDHPNITLLNSSTHNTTATDSSVLTLRNSAAGWTALVTLKLLISVVSVLLNSAVLLIHYFIPAYINPFSVYLLALYLANLFYILTSRPMEILDELYGLYPNAGYPVCMLYLYQKVSSIVPVLFHVLISLNRVWAVTFPVSYRERHTRRLAVFICLGIVAYVHILNLPPYLIDAIKYYPAVFAKYHDCGHISTNSLDFPKADEIINRLLPTCIVLVSYVFIIVKRWKRKTPRSNQVSTSRSTRTAQEMYAWQPARKMFNRPRRAVKPFVVVSVTTISVLICYLPVQVIFFLSLFYRINPPRNVYSAVTTLYSLEMIVDPLMWICSLRRIRKP
ncbi:5-hydroxytryptamine receptor 1B-like [Paramacrobiotus metropolitanus]|uniref:5-hydroxytryptamine receptor 1B-like n=1 Tax=Paramacrobiotus metropolitanus TaxID=2943436 RepID=UPI002445C79E|nr:5-hydroxytryptamine receptor 1B-like [Paramacrobiotus metropolitanus]